MRKLMGLVKKLVIAMGLVALVLIVFPRHAQPLWEWTKSTTAEVGHDPLPSFDAGQNYAGFIVLGVALMAVVYSMWRDRSYEVLRAEYTHQTGANHLRRQIRELQNRMKELAAERQEWKDKYAALEEKHSSALVASKEHEVRSEYGQEDRQVLKNLRDQFDRLIAEKGHADGFREAMELMMVNLSDQTPSQDRQTQVSSCVSSRESNGLENRTTSNSRSNRLGLSDIQLSDVQTRS